MLSKKVMGLVTTGALLVVACSTFQSAKNSSNQRYVASVDSWRSTPASNLSSGMLSNLSSSGKMNLSNAKLITDNNRAFQSKLDIVRNAKKEIRMVYYIYSDDFTSSVFNTEIIAAARRGVKVRLLVDFITNYDRLDLFSYLESVGQGNIEVRFYGLPTETVLKGAVYQTLPCSKEAVKAPDQCQTEKTELLKGMGNPQSTWFSKIYLTGLYGKNPVLLQTAMGLGGQFDPKTLKGSAASPQEKAKLKQFAKLVVAAKMKNDLVAKVKVGMALHTYGETLNPIMNELTGRLPLENGNFKDWDHLTDYTHHKLIVADGERFQLGGRNVEDSYHTDRITSQIKDAKGKYTFMDTDFYGETSGASSVEAAFDRLFNFSPMVGGLQKAQTLVPNEYDVNADAFKMSLGACLQEGKAQPQDLEACVNSKLPSVKGYQSLADRMEAVSKNMATKSQRFVAEYKPRSDQSWKPNGDSLEPNDVNSAEAFYLENLTFLKNKPTERIFGAKLGFEAESGKYLHAAWLKGLENVCAVSAKTKQNKRVILHSAYLFLSSGLTNALGNMINGKWNCHYVDVVMITNSFQTTDLNVINIFARYQMQALFSYNQSIEKSDSSPTANQNKARIHYYEYAPAKEGAGISLHSKVSVLGDDMIIGSANSDIRSYMMDTNNGVYVRNASRMVSDYTAFVDRIISQNKVIDFTSYYANVSNDRLVAENRAILRALLQKYEAGKKVTPQRQETILNYVDQMGAKIRSTTQAIISSPGSLNSAAGDGSSQSDKIKELDQMANTFDAVWKVL